MAGGGLAKCGFGKLLLRSPLGLGGLMGLVIGLLPCGDPTVESRARGYGALPEIENESRVYNLEVVGAEYTASREGVTGHNASAVPPGGSRSGFWRSWVVSPHIKKVLSRTEWPRLLGDRYDAFVTAIADAPFWQRSVFLRFARAFHARGLQEIPAANVSALLSVLTSQTGPILAAMGGERAGRLLAQVVSSPVETAASLAQALGAMNTWAEAEQLLGILELADLSRLTPASLDAARLFVLGSRFADSRWSTAFDQPDQPEPWLLRLKARFLQATPEERQAFVSFLAGAPVHRLGPMINALRGLIHEDPLTTPRQPWRASRSSFGLFGCKGIRQGFTPSTWSKGRAKEKLRE